MKEYVEMTIEQALKLNNGNTNAKVMVAMNNLEKDEVVEFERVWVVNEDNEVVLKKNTKHNYRFRQ